MYFNLIIKTKMKNTMWIKDFWLVVSLWIAMIMIEIISTAYHEASAKMELLEKQSFQKTDLITKQRLREQDIEAFYIFYSRQTVYLCFLKPIMVKINVF